MRQIYVAVYDPKGEIDTIERFDSEDRASGYCDGCYEVSERYCGAVFTRRWPETPGDEDEEQAADLLADLVKLRDDDLRVSSRTGATVEAMIEALNNETPPSAAKEGA